MAAEITTLFTPAHVRYCLFHLTAELPSDYLSADPHRASVVYFALNALDVMGAIGYLSAEQRVAITRWLHDGPLKAFTGLPAERPSLHRREFNVAMVYAAIASLVMLGDDLQRVDRNRVRDALPSLQLSGDSAADGAVMAYGPGGEADVRYVYSAAAVAALLDLWPKAGQGKPLNVPRAAAFCIRSQAHDGGFGLCPGNESHGGSTFCATAALALLGLPLLVETPPSPALSADKHPVPSGGEHVAPTASTGGAGGAVCTSSARAADVTSLAVDARWYCCKSETAGGSSATRIAAGLMLHRWLALRQRDLALADECELDGEMAALFHGCCLDVGTGGGGGEASGSAAASGGAGSASPTPAPALVVPSSTAKTANSDEGKEKSSGAADDDEEDEDEPDVNDRVMLAGPGGLTGRPGKPSDVCYTYWVTAAMAALTSRSSAAESGAPASAAFTAAHGDAHCGASAVSDPTRSSKLPSAAPAPPSVDVFAAQHVASFVLSCQHLRTGGFGKDGESLPDPMHTHYALAGLALLGFPGLRRMDPILAITERAATHLRTLHAAWAAEDGVV